MAKQNISPEQYQEYLEKESAKLEAHKEWFAKHKIPKPKSPTVEELKFWNIAGLEASIFVASGLGAALLSAIRTSGVFFLMEILLVEKYGLDQFWGYVLGGVAAFASLLTFEGSLIGSGLIKGRESGKVKVSGFIVGLSLLTVVIASIFSSFTIVQLSDRADLIMTITLAIITGLSSPIASYILFENVGFLRNFVKNTRIQMNDEFMVESKKWDDAVLSSYNSSRNTIVSRIGDNYISSIQDEDSHYEEQPKKKTKVEIAYEFVKEYYFQNKAIPTNQVVSDGTDVSIGTCYEAINNFIIQNEFELIENKILTLEEIEKIKIKKFEKDPKYKELVSFVRDNQRFPDESEIKNMGIPLKTVFQFIKFEEQRIRENNWLTEETIQQALRIEN